MTQGTGVFAALADPTRRQLLEWLDGGGGGTATEFAARLPMSRQAVTKHLKELEAAGLVRGVKTGRETRYTSDPARLQYASEWIAQRTAAWDARLARLASTAEGDDGGDDGDASHVLA